MTAARLILILVAPAVLSACSANRYCARPLPYETAKSIPPLVAPEGLKIPTPASALRVPESKGETLTFGYRTPDPAKPGKTRVTCLDEPPPIPPLPDAPK